MRITIDILMLPEREQYQIYKLLKEKFNDRSKKDALHKDFLYFLSFGEIDTKTFNILKVCRIKNLLELSTYSKSFFVEMRYTGKKLSCSWRNSCINMAWIGRGDDAFNNSLALSEHMKGSGEPDPLLNLQENETILLHVITINVPTLV